MFVSESEMRDALGDAAPAAEEPVIEMPEIEEAVPRLRSARAAEF